MYSDNIYFFNIYCDFSKAFDTPNQELSSDKLANYGIRDTELLSFKIFTQ